MEKPQTIKYVNRHMRVEWFDHERQRDSSGLAWLLGNDAKLSRWSQFNFHSTTSEQHTASECEVGIKDI